MTKTSSLATDLRAGLDPGRVLRASGLIPDEWQERLLREQPQRALLCCARQVGKSVTAAAASLHQAIYVPGSLILMLAPSQRQSQELLRKTRGLLYALSSDAARSLESQQAIELKNGSRILSLPAKEETIRGYSEVSLLVIDEAAWVDDDLYHAVLPMLAVSSGRLLALSTPNGQTGWFHAAWEAPAPWTRIRITAADCPRIAREFLAERRRDMTASRYASEFECEFADAVDSVFAYIDVEAALDPALTPLFAGRW
jgi:hypothetical protein